MISEQRLKEIEDTYRRRPMIKEILAERKQLVAIVADIEEWMSEHGMMCECDTGIGDHCTWCDGAKAICEKIIALEKESGE